MYFFSFLFFDLAASSSKTLAAKVDAMMIVSGSIFPTLSYSWHKKNYNLIAQKLKTVKNNT